jgi:hypothetical protein
MNRILKRPMFRKGGSTNGIMTGLERPGYSVGGLTDGPGGYAGQQNAISKEDYLKDWATAKEIGQEIYPKEKTDINKFLINFGLDLVSRPPQGGLLSTAASAAKGPTQQLYQDIETQKAGKRALDTSLFGTLIGARADILGGGAKAYGKEIGLKNMQTAVTKLRTAYDEYINKNKSFDEIRPLIADTAIVLKNYGVDREAQLKGFLDPSSDFYQDEVRRIAEDLVNKNSKYQGEEGMALATKEAIKIYNERYVQQLFSVITGQDFEQYVEEEDEEPEEKAAGGRIGYQNAGPVMPSAMPSNMPAPGIMSQAPESMDQGPTEPSISYDELRARLPSEITDDIVRLISESPQALEDFATIQTQQDVNNFNTKYGVNLTLPPEA